MENYDEKAKILRKFFEISTGKKNDECFSLHKFEQEKLLEILFTKGNEYLEVNLEEFYNEIKKSRQ